MIEELKRLLGEEKVADNPTTLESVALDESTLTPVSPVALVYAMSSDDVVTAVKYAYEQRVPITVRGAGSALEGSTIPLREGIVLDLSRMQKITRFWPEDLQVEVEPGVIYEQLNDYLKRESLFFPPSPGGSSDVATIGGMTATNASGIYSVKYGGTKDFVLALEIVDGTGRRLRVGDRAVKRSSGYNLVDLIVGSEGTLAVVTSITLKLRGIPEGSRKLAFSFPSEKLAATAVSEMMRFGLDLAAIEFLDRNVIRALNMLNDYGLEELPAIFLEIHGSDSVLDATEEAANMLIADLEGSSLTLNSGQNPWEIRHHVTNAIKLRQPGYSIMRNDVVFPISRLPEMVEYCGQLAEEYSLLVHAFGHVGMGLLHALILARRDLPGEWEKAGELNRRIIQRGVDLGGAISGEHGIGLGHKAMYQKENADKLELLRNLKSAFDPRGILNPGKIFDLH